uniref:RIIa domain-containing protein n=1 Tax=Cacopsylla melanoneura TaxID=428564 RepID=A0A8D8ZGQ7_9HEMI
MINCDDFPQVTVPNEFRDILLELTLNFLMEQPNNIAKFGVEFFTKLEKSKRTKIYRNQAEIDEYRRLCNASERDLPESIKSSVEEVEQLIEPSETSFAIPESVIMMGAEEEQGSVLNEDDLNEEAANEEAANQEVPNEEGAAEEPQNDAADAVAEEAAAVAED